MFSWTLTCDTDLRTCSIHTVKMNQIAKHRQLYSAHKNIHTAVLGRPFLKQFALCYRSVVLSVCLSVCDVRALWPNGWTDQYETWNAGRPRPWPHCVRWGPSSPSPKGAQPPIFGSRPSDHYFRSVCLFVCAESFSAVFDPISITWDTCYMLGSSSVPSGVFIHPAVWPQ